MIVRQPVNMIVDDFPLRMTGMGVASAVIERNAFSKGFGQTLT